jgi:hypothetical protein
VVQPVMKPKRRIQMLVLLALVSATGIFLFRVTPVPGKGSVSVRFQSVTNDAAGNRLALFIATNSTDRLFVRGYSELELRNRPSNVVSKLQITNVDYLKPGQGITFAIPCTEEESPWRLKFYYMGQFHRREAMVYEFGWFLQRNGLVPPRWRGMNWLPRHEAYKMATEWVRDHSDAQSGRRED